MNGIEIRLKGKNFDDLSLPGRPYRVKVQAGGQPSRCQRIGFGQCNGTWSGKNGNRIGGRLPPIRFVDGRGGCLQGKVIRKEGVLDLWFEDSFAGEILIIKEKKR